MSDQQEVENSLQENHENGIPVNESNPEINNLIKDDASEKLKHGHERISEEENKKYFLEFINKSDLIKIILVEKDIFPYKTYELSTSLEELQPKNDFFKSFNSVNDLIEELNNPNSSINFSIFKKQTNVIELFFVFPIEGEDNTMEIELNANQINDREMFRQLFEKYKSIKQEQEEDVTQLKNRMNKIEEILTNMQKEQERIKEEERLEKERLEKERLEKEMENEEHNEQEKDENEGNENMSKKGEVENKNNKKLINEVNFSNKESKKSFQKDNKNIKKGKPEKKKQDKNINNSKKKIK
jgi:hypothetical protein